MTRRESSRWSLFAVVLVFWMTGSDAAADRIYAVRFSPNGQFVASAGASNDGEVWDWQTGGSFLTLVNNGWAQDIAWSGDCTRLMMGSRNDAREYSLLTGSRLHTLNQGGWEVSIRYTADGTKCVIGGKDDAMVDGLVVYWDIASQTALSTITDTNDWITGIDLSPDGSMVASGHFDGETAKIWDLATGSLIHTFSPSFGGWCTWVRFTPDGTKLAGCGGGDNTAKLWDVPTGNLIHTFSGHTGVLRELAVSADGTRLLTGGQDGKVGYWNLQTGANILFMTHGGIIDGVDFSPDGTMAVSGSFSGTIKLWNLQTGALIRTFSGTTSAPSNYWPTAVASANPMSTVTGQTVTFDGSGSVDADGTIVSYEWDFDYDGGTFDVEASAATATHAYSSGGTHTAGLRVTDDDGESGIARVGITVSCISDCTGRACGDDGCGGSCGTCPSSYTCDTQGQCVCPQGTQECSSQCVDTNSDPQNCGSCTNACGQDEVCNQGTCVSQCTGGLTKCSGQCVDTGSDPNNCGSCGNVCGQDEVCNRGSCESQCTGGLTQCGQSCVDLDTDPNHCGSCGNACGPDEDCAEGACVAACPDADGDGHTSQVCGGYDCNDDDDAVYPGARDICGDGIDQDCTGADKNCGTAAGGCVCSHGNDGISLAIFLLLMGGCLLRRR